MRQLILALLVGVALATSFHESPTGYSEWDEYQPIEKQAYNREILDSTFRPGREYKYFYDGQVMNGIPRSSKQNSATRIQTVVILQMPAPGQMILKLEHFRLGKLNKQVHNPRATHPFHFFEPVEVSEQLKNHLQKPVKFNYVDGMIKEIHMESNDSPVSKNIKRGILNLLQINLKEHNSLDSSDAQRTNLPPTTGESKFFRVMETTLEGECETQYSVINLPSNLQGYFTSSSSEESAEEPSSNVNSRLNVTKSINFHRCNRRPEVRYNFRYVTPCKTCDPKYQEPGHYLTPSNVIKYSLAGSRSNFMVERVHSESQYTIEFYSEEGSFINVYTNQTLNLYKTGPISQQLQLQNPVQSKSKLMYSMQWDILNEKIMMNPSGNEEHVHKPQNFVQKVVELAERLAQKSVHEDQGLPISSPNKFALLVSALRKANFDDIQKIHEKLVSSPPSSLTPHQKKFLRDVIPSVTALAGTEPAVKHITQLIREKNVPVMQRASLLRQLHNTLVVSKSIITHVKSLCEEPSVEEHMHVKQACWLSLGTLMRGACGNTQEKLAIDSKFSTHTRCTENHKREFVTALMNKIKESEKWEDKVLYLKSLSNAALDVSIQELEKIIQNRDQYYAPYVRYEAILALRHLSNIMPRKVQKVLMPIFMQPREPSSVRQIAAAIIMQSQPERSLLEMMAKQINREPRRQVAAATYTMMREMANSTNPCHKQLAADLKLALRFTTKISPNLFDTKFLHSTFQSHLRKIGLDLSAFDVMSNNSILPKVLGANIDTNTFGFFNKDLFTFALSSEGIESLIPRFWNNDGYSSFSEVFSRSRHPRNVQPHRQALKQIFEKLGIQARQQNIEPKLYGYYRYQGQESGFLPISEEMIERALEDESLSWNKLVEYLQSGETKHFNWHYATMLEDSQYKLPTALGLPLVVKHKSPILMKFEGNVKAHLKSGKKIDVIANVKPSIIYKRETTVEVWSPDAPSGARVRGLVQLYTPVKAEIVIDYNKYEMDLKYKTPESPVQVLHIETQPVTFTRPRQTHRAIYKEAEEQVVFSEEINRLQKINRHVSSLGLGFHIMGRYTPQQAQPSGNWLPACPLSGPNKIIIQATPSNDQTKEVEMKWSVSGSMRHSEPLTSSLLKPNYESLEESESQSSEEFTPESFSTNVHRFGRLNGKISTKGGSNPAVYQITAHTQMSSNKRFGKLNAKFERVQSSDGPYQMCLESEIMYPEAPETRKSVLNKKVIEHAELRWGESCQANNFIKFSASAERSRRQLRYERENLESYHECKSNPEVSPVACYEYLKFASFMNKYEFNLRYNNVPVSVMNTTSKLFRGLKTAYYWNTDVATVAVRNPANKISGWLYIEPRENSRINVTIKTPRENVTMTDVWTTIPLPRHNIKRSLISSLVDDYTWNSRQPYNTYQTRPICKVRPNYIQTFDGQRYQSRLSKCYSVIAKDGSEQNRFAVLAMNDESNENKVVKILTHNEQVVLKKSGADFVVKQNGESKNINEYSTEQDESEYQPNLCSRVGSMIRCSFENEAVKVYYDGRNVDVKISPWYVNNQYGLCGNMNYEPNDDFRMPNSEFENDVRQFQSNYILKEPECESSIPELNSYCDSESCEYQPQFSRSSSEESSYEIPSEYHNKKSMEPRQLNKVVHKQGKLCFSKEPVPQCSMHAHPAQAEQREIEYACVSSHNMEAADWARNARQEPIPEVRDMETSFTRSELVAKKCYNY